MVLCEPDFGFVQDGTRRDEAFQREQQVWYDSQLATRGEPVVRVRGAVQDRVRQVLAAIDVLC